MDAYVVVRERVAFAVDKPTDELKRFCAAGGSLDMRGGVGNVIDSRESAPYPSHWNLPNVDRMLAKSTDR